MNNYPIMCDAYQLWRANMDIKPALSKHAMVQYLTKYVTKSEPPSESLKKIASNVVRRAESAAVQPRVGEVYGKALVGSVGDRHGGAGSLSPRP